MADKKTRSQPTDKEQPSTGLALRGGGLAGVFDDLFRPFDDFFPPAMRSFLQEGAGMRQPILDVQDRGDHFSVTAELPGFDKNEVEVKVTDGGIELKASKTENGKGEKGVHTTSSRSYYQFLSLPGQVKSEKIDGTMKNGVLELKIPKRAQLKDNSRKVDLK